MLDKLKEIWKGLNFIKKTAVLCVFSIIFMWAFFLSPKMSDLRKVKMEATIIEGRLHQERLKLINAQREIQEFNVYKERLEEINKDLDAVQDSLISEAELLNLTNILTFKENAIRYISFSADTIREEDLYKVLPIQIKLETTYFLLGQYLEYIEESDFIISFQEISASKKSGSYNIIEADILLEAYITK